LRRRGGKRGVLRFREVESREGRHEL
jgi:hypothetical protein